MVIGVLSFTGAYLAGLYVHLQCLRKFCNQRKRRVGLVYFRKRRVRQPNFNYTLVVTMWLLWEQCIDIDTGVTGGKWR